MAPMPKLLGFHIVFSTYGFWLPNDPRGSWSEFVRRWELVRFGKATKVTTRRSLAADARNVSARLAAKKALKYPEVFFSGRQALSVARGFAIAVEESAYSVLACFILPQHVHLVLGPQEARVQRIVGHLKTRATQHLLDDGLHPLASFRQRDGSVPSVWGRNSWKVYLYDRRHFINSIRYVEANPEKEGKRRQRWSFVDSVRNNDGRAGGASSAAK
jgi:REP element-mobilizing transposase RayT